MSGFRPSWAISDEATGSASNHNHGRRVIKQGLRRRASSHGAGEVSASGPSRASTGNAEPYQPHMLSEPRSCRKVFRHQMTPDRPNSRVDGGRHWHENSERRGVFVQYGSRDASVSDVAPYR